MERRDFMKKSALATAAFGFPTIVPASVFGKKMHQAIRSTSDRSDVVESHATMTYRVPGDMISLES